MAEVQHLIQVSDYEQRLMVNGLNAFRNDLIRDGKPTEDNTADIENAILPGQLIVHGQSSFSASSPARQ